MVYIPFWICAFAGAVIDVRERRFPNALAAACAVAAFAGVWLDAGLNTTLDHAGLAVIVYLFLALTESLWRRLRQTPGIGMGDADRREAQLGRLRLDPGFQLVLRHIRPLPQAIREGQSRGQSVGGQRLGPRQTLR